MEKWKDVRRFEGKYQVSDKGNVRSLIKGCHEVAQTINSNGYPYVSLALPGHRTKKCRVHRLVAEAFIDNPNGYTQVNHKDECKLNNNVANLEWCTSSYNINYGSRNNKHSQKLSKPVVQIDFDGNIVNKWKSMTEAEKTLGFNKRNISNCCRGVRQTAYGYRWRYE